MSALDGHKVDRRVLTSSIDLKIEFVTLAFIERRQARTFNRADMHEGIGLAVIADQEAEALHRIEELDRAGCFLSGQLALWCSRTLLDRNHIPDNLKILGGNLPATIDQVEFKLLPFSKAIETGAFNRADVDEDIFASALLLDEAESLLSIEEFDHALAGADNLGRHAIAAAARTTATAAAKSAITTTTAPVSSEAIVTKPVGAKIARRGITFRPTGERIEAVFAETVALIPTPAAPSVVTHILRNTLSDAQLQDRRKSGRQLIRTK